MNGKSHLKETYTSEEYKADVTGFSLNEKHQIFDWLDKGCSNYTIISHAYDDFGIFPDEIDLDAVFIEYEQLFGVEYYIVECKAVVHENNKVALFNQEAIFTDKAEALRQIQISYEAGEDIIAYKSINGTKHTWQAWQDN